MIRAALVGTGFIAGVHAEAIARATGVELACVVERSRREPAWGDRHGVPTFRTLTEAAEATDVDLAVVTVPTGAHVAVATEALGLGLHVLLEKPADITLEKVDGLLEVERASGVTVAVVSQHRFDAGTALVRQRIAEGAFGRITSGLASTAWWRPQAYFDESDWRGTWRHDGGGAVINQGIHALDLLVHLLGRPTEVFAWAATLAHAIEVEDTAVGVVRFENGTLGMLHATTAANPGLSVTLGVMGTRGSALLENHQLRYLHHGEGHDDPRLREGSLTITNQVDELPPDLREAVQAEEPLGVGHARQYEAMVDALEAWKAGERGVRPPVSLADHRVSLALVLGLYESARTGLPVSL
ncbi:Gfo/Idh/MocA family protein [Aestuariimicrobium soli]|uniref:Gfo/Idh/MocA family protein n=1 Tax=Aestuariimicrobium soli TaxID=2035834 RepID=UPI003EC0D0EE